MPRLAPAALALALATPAPADQPVWGTLNGDLAATRFSGVESLTPDTVGRLERGWEAPTGDVSDGAGERPETVWPATPTHAIGTPFCRVLAPAPRPARSAGATTASPRWRR